MLLFPPAARHAVLPPFQRGGDMQRAFARHRFPVAGDVHTAFKQGQRVRINWWGTHIEEEIAAVIVQVWPRKVDYVFHFVYNKRRVTMTYPEHLIKEWNPEPPKPPTKSAGDYGIRPFVKPAPPILNFTPLLRAVALQARVEMHHLSIEIQMMGTQLELERLKDATKALECRSLPKKRVLTPRKPKTRETIKRAPNRAMPPKYRVRKVAA